MSKLFTRLLACLALICCMTASQKVMASHYAAADMKITLDTGIGRPPIDTNHPRYRITLSVYKVCETGNIDLSAAEPLTYTSSNIGGGGFSLSRSIAKVVPSRQGHSTGFDTLNIICPQFTNSCQSTASPYPAFVRADYIDTFTIPSRQTDWKFYWESSSRNVNIQNLDQGAPNYNSSIHLEDGINNAKAGRWDVVPPYYTVDPVPYACINQPNHFANGPADVNTDHNDSLRTINKVPQGASGVDFGYLSPYTIANPIGSLSTYPYRVDTTYGTASFIPQYPGKHVLGFRTIKWDRVDSPHVQLGYVSRDVQVFVGPCSSAPPTIDTSIQNLMGARQIDSTTVAACPGVQMSFDVHLASNNPASNLKLRIIQTPPGSLLTNVVNNNQLLGHFSWTPSANDVGGHIVIFHGVDSTCSAGQPAVLSADFIITIKILPGLDAGPDASVCPLGDRPYQLHVTGPNTPIYKWTMLNGQTARYLSCTTCNSPLASPPVTTTYIVSSTDPIFVCKQADTVTINVDNSNAVKAVPENMVVCRPGYIQFAADSIGPNPVANLACGSSNPVTCNIPDSATIGSGTNAPAAITNSPFYTSARYARYQFILPRQELRAAGMNSGTISSISFLSINPVVVGTNPPKNINIYLKCSNRSSYPIQGTAGDFETGGTLVATVGSYAIAPGQWNKINFITPYNWDTTQNIIVDMCMGLDSPVNANSDLFAVTPGSAIQAYGTTSQCSTPNSNIGTYPQRPVVKFQYCIAPDAPWRYWWTPGRQLNDSNIKYPIAYVDRSTQYFVYGIGRNGCKVRDSLQIYVPVHHVYASPHDSFVCQGALVPLHATGGLTYKWYENGFSQATSLTCDDCADPIARPQATTTYTIVYNDDVDCHDTLYLTVNVWPSPTVSIATPDTTINYGSSIMLYGNGAFTYSWTPVGTLTDPNIPNPVATPTQNTSYILYGLDRNGCQGTDTVNIKVNFASRLMVPSGFTPNNDGKNDFFKVINMTPNQKLIEFRVFNRWGQEIFSTTDASKGWDGTWKDVPQEMGVYQYLIRVGFADGLIETYKGDVTLIR